MSGWENGIDLTAVARKLHDAASDGLDDGIDVVFADSQRKVPVDTGQLKASGRIDGDDLRRRIRYTDPIAPIVHENLSAHHDDGQAKFLEQAFNSNRRRTAEQIAARIRTDMGS